MQIFGSINAIQRKNSPLRTKTEKKFVLLNINRAGSYLKTVELAARNQKSNERPSTAVKVI